MLRADTGFQLTACLLHAGVLALLQCMNQETFISGGGVTLAQGGMSSPASTAPRPSQVPAADFPSSSAPVIICDGRALLRSPDDWEGYYRLRHGASPDLVVAVFRRQHLGGSDSVRIVPLSAGMVVLARPVRPGTKAEFNYLWAYFGLDAPAPMS